MAKSTRRKPSKTERIRQYIEAHPNESARSVAKVLKASPALVYRVKGSVAGGSSTNSARKRAGDYEGVIVAAKLISICGGVKQAQEALTAAGEISKLIKR